MLMKTNLLQCYYDEDYAYDNADESSENAIGHNDNVDDEEESFEYFAEYA